MQIAPIPTLSDDINDIRLRTADIVANRIIPNEGTIYAGGDKSKKLRKEINEEVKSKAYGLRIYLKNMVAWAMDS